MATTQELQAYAAAAAQRENVPVNMFLWQIGKESSWDPNARNPLKGSTATGIAQFTDPTAKDFKLNSLDPFASLDAAAKYDAQLYKKTGSWEKALTSYGTLAGADQATKAAFNMALAKDNATTEDRGFIGSVLDNLGDVFTDPYGLYKTIGKGAINGAESASGAITGQDNSGIIGRSFAAIGGNITFILLGIVVVALAVLSNNTVRAAATKVVTKGVA